MMLSTHFSLEELVASEVATRRGLDNTPPNEVMPNLYTLLWWPSLDLQAQILDDGEHVADISDLRVLGSTD